MSEKNGFHGEVGQAVIGDVNEGARLSNVVNLHLNESKKEVQRITEYQRRRIKVLVREWSAICGDEEIEIYKIFIEDFGIRYFRELPIEHYMTVKKTLEEWIAAGSDKASAKSSSAPTSHSALPVHERTVCAACAEKDLSFSRLQRTIFSQWLLILILALSCAWLLYQMPAPGDAATAEQYCLFDGKPYSVGSAIRGAGGMLRECMSDGTGTAMTWGQPK
ncbi:hypothetical protein HBH1_03264 [Herbaspirillum sp. BH-1]|uniref:hypothetical protein n=1 Tax=Herbaspirillum sp. (strain BH-1) TaxID=2058884 RepID=UPI000C87E615|nr:hypothetical protein [Herbaspirillum sp. BH-1]PLY58473.1 hypothetical protein HBH1_03264 [Herbaspirillum sp. BH-1]